MNNIIIKTILFLLFISTTVSAQTPVTITKPESPNTSYIVTQSETLIASQSITLKPGTNIKPSAGNVFTAMIAADAYTSIAFSNENYVLTRTFQKEMNSVSSIRNNSDVIESITYFDGLGRPMQNIAVKSSPTKQDIITHIGYDGFGRQDKDYLPFMPSTGAIGSYRTGADTSTNSYYTTNFATEINSSKPNPFSEKLFENSPLNRILQQGAPGKDWALGSGHEIKMNYETNKANEVKLFTALTSWNITSELYDINLGNPQGNIFYQPNQLYKTVTKNENWVSGTDNTTEEFKDKEGRIILKRTYGYSIVNNQPQNTAHDTYYVYDIYGNLTFVFPPKADGAITVAVLNDLCYQYKYDYRNRLVEKKLPGKDWEYIVYNKLDQPVLTQDAILRSNNNWLFTKYDPFGRIVYKGEYANSTQTTRFSLQKLVNTFASQYENRQANVLNINGTNLNYSNISFPNSGLNVTSIEYYDNYNTIDLDGAAPVVSYGITPISNAKGLTTCSKVRILGTTSWTTTVNYYDMKGRQIYNYSKNNYLDLVETVKTQFDFAGKVLETVKTHKKGTNALMTIADTYAYDNVGRLLTQKQSINNQVQEVIASNTYNNLGQLIIKSVGGKTTQPRLQNIDYKYNIRGWLKSINNVNAMGTNLFAFSINYNDISAGSTPLFNGNISQIFSRTANIDNTLRSYTYGYDELNRLIYAIGDQDDQQEIPSYDKNGNIVNMYRTNKKPKNTGTSKLVMSVIDDLTYTYDGGNKLVKVDDSTRNPEGFKDGANLAIEYTYDGNGNMRTDANKGITNINYNYLNLPTSVSMAGGTITYTYDAAGAKLRKVVSGITTDYAGGFQYQNNVLQFLPHPEGYVYNNNGVFDYIYQYKDHLGNVRLSYDKNLKIVEENNYYPFGLKQYDNNNVVNAIGNAAAQKYKYNGKEFQDELGLSFYDYGARNYDPALGRWMNIDPLAEKGRRWSSYNYAMDNPVYFIDPDGMWPDNPIRGLVNRATASVKNYVVHKVSTVVSNARNLVSQKANSMLDAIRIGKFENTGRDSGHGGYDFRSSLRNGEDSSGKVQKDKGENNTQVVDITGLDALSTFVGFSTGTKTISKSGKVVDALTDFAKSAKSTPDGWFIGQNAGEVMDQATIEIEGKASMDDMKENEKKAPKEQDSVTVLSYNKKGDLIDEKRKAK